MNTKAEYIIIGKFGATYGVRGWIKVYPYTEYDRNILTYSPWYLASNDTSTQKDVVMVEDGRPHGKFIIAKLKDVNTPEAARCYTGKAIQILRSQLPKLKANEYYWADLEGLTVINTQGKILGQVIYLIATGANDVLVVKGAKEEAIPYLPGKVIIAVDLNKQEILVDWEGQA